MMVWLMVDGWMDITTTRTDYTPSRPTYCTLTTMDKWNGKFNQTKPNQHKKARSGVEGSRRQILTFVVCMEWRFLWRFDWHGRQQTKKITLHYYMPRKQRTYVPANNPCADDMTVYLAFVFDERPTDRPTGPLDRYNIHISSGPEVCGGWWLCLCCGFRRL